MKLRPLYALCAVLLLAACKDDNESPTFKKEDLIGTWLRTSTTIDEGDRMCRAKELQITEAEITEVYDDESSIYQDFLFEKNTVSFYNEDVEIHYQMILTSLDETKMNVDWKIEGQKIGSSTYEKQ
jgi:hypothetical protein